MFDFDDVDTDDSFEDGVLNDEVSTHLDSISFGESKSERTLEYDLRQAQKNVDYYQREIQNFSEFTTDTYKNNCFSHLEKALERVEDISEKLERIRSK